MTTQITVTAEVRRYDPATDEAPQYQSFEVTGMDNMRVLDVIRSIYENQAGDLAFQFACRSGRCGAAPLLSCAGSRSSRPIPKYPKTTDRRSPTGWCHRTARRPLAGCRRPSAHHRGLGVRSPGRVGPTARRPR